MWSGSIAELPDFIRIFAIISSFLLSVLSGLGAAGFLAGTPFFTYMLHSLDVRSQPIAILSILSLLSAAENVTV